MKSPSLKELYEGLEGVYFRCDCGSNEHSFAIDCDLDKKHPFASTLFIEIHLSTHHGFFGRLWRGLRYAFGYRCRYGDWDEILLNVDTVARLRDICNRFLEYVVDLQAMADAEAEYRAGGGCSFEEVAEEVLRDRSELWEGLAEV